MTDLFGNIPIQGDSPEKKKRPAPPAASKHKRETHTKVKPTPQRPKEEKKGDTGKSKLRYLLVPLLILALFGCYYGLSALLVPYYIKEKLPQSLQAETGLLLSVEKVAYNPLTTELELYDITVDTVAKTAQKTRIAHVEKVVGDMDVVAYLRHDIVTKQLIVQGADIQLTRYQDGSYTVSDIFTHYKKEETGEMDFLEIPFLYSLNNIKISESSLLFQDLMADKEHKIDDIEIQIPSLSNFSYVVDQYIQPGFSATVNGSPVKLVSKVRQGGHQDGPARTRLSYTLESVDLQLYTSYAPFTLPAQVKKGKASGNIDLTFTGDEETGRQLNLHFSLNVEDSVFASEAATLAIPSFSIEGDVQPLKNNISIANLLVREPELRLHKPLTADSADASNIQKKPSDDKQKTMIGERSLPSLSVDLLVCDNGTVEIAGREKTTRFHSVQLSIKNYTDTHEDLQKASAVPQNKGTFRLQSSQELGFITWRGKINNSRFTGPLEGQNIKLQQMVNFLSKNSTEIAGSADIKGELTFSAVSPKPHFSLDKAHIILDDVSFSEKKRTWFSSDLIRISEAHFSDETLDVGNIFVEDGYLTLTDTHTPSFFTSFLGKKKFRFKGIDYKGKLSFQSAEHPPVLLNTVSFQVLSQPNNAGENFALSAHADTKGSVQAKGKINILPLRGTLQIHVNKVASSQAMRSLFEPLALLTPSTIFSATGEITLPVGSFAGSFVLENGAIQQGNTRHAFAQAAFAECVLQPKKKQLSAKKIHIVNYSNTSAGTTVSAASLLLDRYVFADSKLNIGGIVGKKAAITTTRPLLSAIKTSAEQLAPLSLSSADISGTFSSAPQKDDASTVLVKKQKGSFAFSSSAITGKVPGKPNLHFTVTLKEAGRIEGAAAVSSSLQQGDTFFTLHDVPSQSLAALADNMFFTSLRGKISGKVKSSFQSPHYSGSVAITNGSLIAAGKPFLSWNKAVFTDFSYIPGSAGSSIASLEMNAPSMKIVRGETSLPAAIFSRIAQVFPETEKEASAISFSSLNIQEIQVTDGKIATTHFGTAQKKEQLLSALDGTITHFHISKTHDPIGYSFTGEVDQTPFTVSGELDAGKENGNTLSSFSLSRLPLSSYAEEFAAIFPENNTFSSLLLDLTLEDSGFNQQDLTFTLIFPEKPLPQEDLPSFTRYLITPENTIHNTITLQENDQGILSQLSTHLQTLKIKSSLSPALLLPAYFQEIPLEHTVYFAEGDSSLPSKDALEFEELCQILQQRPYLHLELSGVVNPVGDRRVIRQRLEEREAERVRLENIRLEKEWQEKMANQKTTQQPSTDGTITERDIPVTQLNAFIPVKAKPQSVTDEMLTSLGRSRLKALQDFIVEKYSIDPARIDIVKDIQLIDDLDSPSITLKISG